MSADSVTLHAAQLVPGSLAIFYQGTSVLADGDGVPFANGLRCLGGVTRFLGSRSASGSGLASFGAGVAGDPLVSVQGAIWPGGGSRCFQVEYRDSGPGCGGIALNTSNAIVIGWLP